MNIDFIRRFLKYVYNQMKGFQLSGKSSRGQKIDTTLDDGEETERCELASGRKMFQRKLDDTRGSKPMSSS